MNIRMEERLVFAILTVRGTGKTLKGNLDNFRDIWETGTSLGNLVYIVTAKDLVLSGDTVRGYTFNKNKGTWEPGRFPLPHVVYNRIPNRTHESRPSVRRKLRELSRRSDIAIYNPSFFNKWNLFQWLKSSKNTRKFIPATRKLNNAHGLEELLQEFPFLYLKPESGKAGKGIMLLKYNKEQPLPYRLKIQSTRKSTTYKTGNLQKLWARIRKETGSTPYIFQQGIELTLYRKRPFDLRVLVQKNERGHWSVTGIGARLAGARSITTHVPRGGSVENPETLLSRLFGSDMSNTLLQRVYNSATQIARQVEIGAGASLGEMSMDLGVDGSGDLWFFEANAKPMKFDEPDIRRKSLERIFEYSSYLANQLKAGG